MVSPHQVWEHREGALCSGRRLEKRLDRLDVIRGNHAYFIGSTARVGEIDNNEA